MRNRFGNATKSGPRLFLLFIMVLLIAYLFYLHFFKEKGVSKFGSSIQTFVQNYTNNYYVFVSSTDQCCIAINENKPENYVNRLYDIQLNTAYSRTSTSKDSLYEIPKNKINAAVPVKIWVLYYDTSTSKYTPLSMDPKYINLSQNQKNSSNNEYYTKDIIDTTNKATVIGKANCIINQMKYITYGTIYKCIALIGDNDYFYVSSVTDSAPTTVNWRLNIPGGAFNTIKDFSFSYDQSIALVSSTGALWYGNFMEGLPNPWVVVDANANANKVSFNNGLIYCINTSNEIWIWTKNMNSTTGAITFSKSPNKLSASGTNNPDNKYQSISVNQDGSMFVSFYDTWKLWYRTPGGTWKQNLSGGGSNVSSNNGIMCMLGDGGTTIYYYTRNGDIISGSGPQIFHPNQAGGRRWRNVTVNPGSNVRSVLACDDLNDMYYCADITISPYNWTKYNGKAKKLVMSDF